MKQHVETPLFSVPVNVRTLPRKGHKAEYCATQEVRAELARRFDLIELLAYSGTCLVAPWKKDGVKIVGSVSAKLVQSCAVTAEPLQTSIDEEIDIVFVPRGSKLARPGMGENGEIILDPEGDDLPEPFDGDTIDLADIWLEFFALGFNPFARSPGAQLPQRDASDAEESPFAALSALKKH